MTSSTTGIRERHSRRCTSADGGRCNCTPTIEAFVYSRRDHKKIRETFTGKGARAAAKTWRQDAAGALRRGTMRAPTATTIRQAWETWEAGAKGGTLRSRSGDRYKPSVLRSYESSMRLRVLPEIGAVKLSDVQRVDLQDLADRWLTKGLDPSTIRNTLMPLRAIFRRAVSRGELAVNPTTGLELPAVRGTRDRYATPEEAAELIAAAPEQDRALWATALYAGLRRGELMALDWQHVDLDAGVIYVERSWDVQAGVIETKSRAGRRTVPIASLLRGLLLEHRLRQGRGGVGLVFGRTAEKPFEPGSVRTRALTAWKRENDRRKNAAEEAGREDDEVVLLEPIGLHECRHTFASLMIAAGVNAKALSTYMGHSSITITLDRYGHLMPGNEEQAAGLLDAYLASGTARASSYGEVSPLNR
jgi:integrase